MASITREANGRRLIQFCDTNGKRRSIRFGKVSQRVAEAIKIKIESLITSKITGTSIDDETSRWVATITEDMADKLALVGLIPTRKKAEKRCLTIGDFIDQYIASRSDIKDRTKNNLDQAKKHLIQFFGQNKPLGDITPGEADECRLHLMKRLSENTARRHCGRAKQFFRAAQRKHLIQANPFADMKGCSVKENRSRMYFITNQEAQKVLEHCPDAQWRLIFALARYGGLRTPSETFALKWGHVDWERGRINVTSPKTAHHEGKQSRLIPLFPELRPHLEAVWEQAEPGAEYIITRYRNNNANLRTQLERIILRAGLKSWPKLFQNLRSTRETELVEDYPIHVVCAWIGNSAKVATKHYLQVREEDFNRAAMGAAKSDAKALQNPVQQPAADISKNSQTISEAFENKRVMLADATSCNSVHNYTVPRTGFEPVTTGLGNQCSIL
jgi:integrase